MTRDIFGSIFQEVREAMIGSQDLIDGLTSGRLQVFGAEYQEESESELESSTAERMMALRILAAQLASNPA